MKVGDLLFIDHPAYLHVVAKICTNLFILKRCLNCKIICSTIATYTV